MFRVTKKFLKLLMKCVIMEKTADLVTLKQTVQIFLTLFLYLPFWVLLVQKSHLY